MTRRRPFSIRVARPRLLAGGAACVAVALTTAMARPEPPASTAGGVDRVDRPPASGLVTLQLLGVNDLHGHLEPSAPEQQRDGELVRTGGAAWLAAHLDRAERSRPGRTIRVHAGDMVGASPLVSSRAHDEPTVKAMNLMRFDVGTLGNHEFDEGGAEALRLVRGGRRNGAETAKPDTAGSAVNTSDPAFAGAAFPYLAANTVDRRGRGVLPPYTIVERAGVRVGFIGVTTESSPDFLLERHASAQRFTDVSATVDRYARELRRRGVEAIVVLAHAGGTERAGSGTARGEIIDETRQMTDAVDVVVAGHSHSVLDTRVRNRSGRGTKLVVEASSYGEAYDRIELTVDRASGDVVAKAAEVPRTWHDRVDPHRGVAALVAAYARSASAVAGQLHGRAGQDFGRGGAGDSGTSDLGRLVADGQRALAGADLAFVDPVAVRGSLAAGPLTYAELFEISPADHPLVRTHMRGADVKRLLEEQFSDAETIRLHASGLSYQTDRSAPAGRRVTGIELADGRPLEPEQTYTVAASELLATGERFSTFRGQSRAAQRVGTEVEALVAEVERRPAGFR